MTATVRTLLALLVAVGAVAAACGGATDGAASPVATTSVDLPPSYRFAPAAISIAVGATVTWTNHDNFSHTVDLADDPAPPLSMAPGESASHTFDAAGRFDYVCSLHPNDMRGSVVVE
jgi:plastocyanin